MKRFLLLSAVCLAALSLAAQDQPSRPKITGIAHVRLYAADLTAAREFYMRVLGLKVASDFSDRGIAFRCGAGVVIVFNPAKSRDAHKGIPRPHTIMAKISQNGVRFRYAEYTMQTPPPMARAIRRPGSYASANATSAAERTS